MLSVTTEALTERSGRIEKRIHEEGLDEHKKRRYNERYCELLTTVVLTQLMDTVNGHGSDGRLTCSEAAKLTAANLETN